MQTSANEVKMQIAFYASTPSYRAVLDQHGWGEISDELRAMSKEGRWFEMATLITDDMLEEFAVVAPVTELAQKVRARYEGALDRVAYYYPFVPGEREAIWQNAAETFTI